MSGGGGTDRSGGALRRSEDCGDRGSSGGKPLIFAAYLYA
jgi:hypothetical protein